MIIFLGPYFKILILLFEILLFINFFKIDHYFYNLFIKPSISASSLYFLFINSYFFIFSYIFYFIFNKYNFILYINLIILHYHHLLI